jgi:hypothetical protein
MKSPNEEEVAAYLRASLARGASRPSRPEARRCSAYSRISIAAGQSLADG